VEVWLEDPRLDQVAVRTVDRLLETASGQELVAELCELMSSKAIGEGVSPVIEIHIVRTLPRCSEDADGCFEPSEPGADRYTVLARAYPTDNDPLHVTTVLGEYPGNPDCDVVFLFREPESWMAQTLYHELLHIWFINTFDRRARRYPTGHGVATRCEFETDFLERLDANAEDLAIAEGQLRRRYTHSSTHTLELRY
jgi:hypothetical protein